MMRGPTRPAATTFMKAGLISLTSFWLI